MQQSKSASMGRQFFRYALPAVTGMVVSSLYTVVDGIMVGRGVGDVALAAVNIVYPFIMLQIALSMLIAIGGANVYSIRCGAGEDARSVNNVFAQSVGLLIAVAVALNAVVLVFGEGVCRLLGADEELLPHAVTYLRWIALFGFVQMPGMGISIFVRNDGAPQLEMIGTIIGALTNIALDYLFIMRFGWGLAGAAIATGIGQCLSVVVYLTHFARKRGALRFAVPKFLRADCTKLLYNGLATFLMEFSQSAVALSFNLVLVRYAGAQGVAVYSIVMYICSMFNMVLIGLTQGAQPILSFNHGAQCEDNVRKIHDLGVGAGLCLTALFYALVFAFGQNLAGLFVTDAAELTGAAAEMMRCYFLGFFPISVSLMNILYFQTTEREGYSIALSALRCVGFVQVFLLVLPRFFGLQGIYFAFLAGEACNCLISCAAMKHVLRIVYGAGSARRQRRSSSATP